MEQFQVAQSKPTNRDREGEEEGAECGSIGGVVLNCSQPVIKTSVKTTTVMMMMMVVVMLPDDRQERFEGKQVKSGPTPK
jgi:hypothetical protein